MSLLRSEWIQPFILTAIFLSCLSGVAWAHPDTQAKYSRDSKTPCLEKKLTAQSSYLQDFGGGAVLRIPRCLIPGLKIKDPGKPIEAGALSMVFWYPDMTLTMWKPSIDYFLDEAGHKKYIPQRNRFRVYIIDLYYSKGDYLYGGPTPHQIEKNMAVAGAVKRISTPYPGLMSEVSKKWLNEHPKDLDFDPKRAGRFTEKSNSPYDLYMRCAPPATVDPGVNCRANVYEKEHKFQYFMLFPSEAVANTDALIRSVNKLIDRWWVR